MKYKILGFALVIFIGIWFFFMFRPGEGIDPVLLKSSNIDSITTSNLGSNAGIYHYTDIHQVSNLLQKADRIIVKNPKGNKGFYELNFYVKGKRNPIELRISENIQGIVLRANDFYYQGVALDSLIRKLVIQ